MTPLQAALVDHAMLHKRVGDYAQNPDRSLKDSDVRADDACSLARWLSTNGTNAPELVALGAAHTGYHRVCADTVRHADSGSLPVGWLDEGGELKGALQRLGAAIAMVIFHGWGSPSKQAAQWVPPSYARPDSYAERDVRVGSTPALPGALTQPKGAGPWPVVVLVHGSGLRDADDSIGAVKPFRDLAWGLASRGVAVLRYVKRTHHAPAGVITIKEEVLDGAHAAVEVCRAMPGIDPRRIVVAGHSQGGALAPRIAIEDPGVAAIIMLAAPSRPMQDLVVDQFMYLAELEPHNAGALKGVEMAKRFKARLDDPRLGPDEDVVLPDGGTRKGAYFLSTRGYRPAEVAAKLAIPTLLLQGERDYQITAPDIGAYEHALAGRRNVTIKRYPSLNHLFVAGTGRSSPAEYQRLGHVDEQVIADIASWIDTRVRP